jgi:hypothetical protein
MTAIDDEYFNMENTSNSARQQTNKTNSQIKKNSLLNERTLSHSDSSNLTLAAKLQYGKAKPTVF